MKGEDGAHRGEIGTVGGEGEATLTRCEKLPSRVYASWVAMTVSSGAASSVNRTDGVQ